MPSAKIRAEIERPDLKRLLVRPHVDLTAEMEQVVGRRWSQHHGGWLVANDAANRSQLAQLLGPDGVKGFGALNSNGNGHNPHILIGEDRAQKQLDQILRKLGYSPRTASVYAAQGIRFLRYVGSVDRRDVKKADTEVDGYMAEVLDVKGVSGSFGAQAARAVELVLEHYGNVPPGRVPKARRPDRRGPRRTELILTRAQVEGLITAVEHPKYRAMIGLLYGAGLTMGEMLHLHVRDLDAERGVIRAHGSDRAEREVPYGPRLQRLVGEYLAAEPQADVLFPGKGRAKYMSESNVSRMIRDGAAEIGLPGVSSFVLRDSFAVELLRRGVDVAAVRDVLGLATNASLARYLVHVPNREFPPVPSPLDPAPRS